MKVEIETFIYQRLPDAFMRAYQKLKAPELIIYDVPLLFEKNLDNLVDINVLVYAPRKIQGIRLMNRDGILEDLAESILDQQMSIEDKKRKAQFIIDNSKTETELAEEIKQFLRQILE
jgi:dephospho-CoA kinase